MAFVAEDGTGLPDANSAVSVEYADAYFSLRAVEAWADLSVAEKEVALIKGTDYAQARYATKFPAPALSNEQSLLFPKKFIVVAGGSRIQGTPDNWKKAVCEYALISSKNDLYAAATTDAKEVKSKEVTVGPITTKTSYETAKPTIFLSYPVADNLVRTLFGTAGSVVR